MRMPDSHGGPEANLHEIQVSHNPEAAKKLGGLEVSGLGFRLRTEGLNPKPSTLKRQKPSIKSCWLCRLSCQVLLRRAPLPSLLA